MERYKEQLSISLPESLKSEIERADGVEIMGVHFLHVVTHIGDDLYITDYGLPYLEDILPDRFARDRDWFNKVKVPLPGSSDPYRIPLKDRTKPVKDVVFKWSRMGTDPMIPGFNAVFNSPFEEFALLEELRGKLAGVIGLQKPLAIYVPSEHYTLETLLRRRSLMDMLERRNSDAHIDIDRNYAVIYEWLEGLDLYQWNKEEKIDFDAAADFTNEARALIDHYGYEVEDHKMNHLVSTDPPADTELSQLYMIDFELLRRNAKHEITIRDYKRQLYSELKRRNRAANRGRETISILDIEYTEKTVKSSGGKLWLLNSIEEMADYFLPEKWQTTARTKMSVTNNTYLTESKDGVKLILKYSRVGIRDTHELTGSSSGITETICGFNSPFEEALVAERLKDAGFPVPELQAIYRMKQETQIVPYMYDDSRFLSHENLLDSEGNPVLMQKRQYVLIWDCYKFFHDMTDPLGAVLGETINMQEAYFRGTADKRTIESLLRLIQFKLKAKGFYDTALKASHFLLCEGEDGNLVRDETGLPLYCLSNFSRISEAE